MQKKRKSGSKKKNTKNHLKRIVTMFILTAAIVFGTLCTGNVTAQAAVRMKYVSGAYRFYVNGSKSYVKNGWVKYNNHWYFISPYGYISIGWKKIDGSWYYFSTGGIMQTGTRNISGRTYKIASSGKLASPSSPRGVKASYANTYTTKASGPKTKAVTSAAVKSTGTVRMKYASGAYRFYVNGSKSYVKNGWVKYNNHWYFISPYGYISIGWKKIDGSWYYFSTGGIMQTGTRNISGRTYKLASSGKLISPSFPGNVKSTSTVTYKTAASKTAVTTVSAKSNSSAAAKTVKTSSVSTSGNSAAVKTYTLSGTKKLFVDRIYSYVRKYAPAYGIRVYSPVLAQAILESNWGQSILSKKYNNYFGLTCGTAWTGGRVSMMTMEEVKGQMVPQVSDWRTYSSMEAGVRGYFDFISAKRYQNLKGVKSPQVYLTNIKADGYATSSVYVTSNMNIIKMYNLTSYDPK